MEVCREASFCDSGNVNMGRKLKLKHLGPQLFGNCLFLPGNCFKGLLIFGIFEEVHESRLRLLLNVTFETRKLTIVSVRGFVFAYL